MIRTTCPSPARCRTTSGSSSSPGSPTGARRGTMRQKPKLHPSLPLLMLGALGLPAGAHGQEAEPPAATFYSTATVRERPLSSATGSVSVLDREAIEASGARTVADLLRFVPGVDVTSGGTRGGLTTAQIRGGDPNFTLVLL